MGERNNWRERLSVNGNGKWIVPILTFLLGALVTAGGYTIAFSRDVTANVVAIRQLERADDKLASQLQDYIKLTQNVVEMNQRLLAEIQADRRVRP